MSRYVHMEDCLVKAKTDKAAMIEYTDADGEVCKDWFPLSQIADGDDLILGGPQTVSVREWLAAERNVE